MASKINTETVADKTADKGKVVAASLPADVRDALEELRWSERKTMSQLVASILRDALVSRGLLTPEA